MRGLVCSCQVSRHEVASTNVCEHKAIWTRPPVVLAVKRATTR